MKTLDHLSIVYLSTLAFANSMQVAASDRLDIDQGGTGGRISANLRDEVGQFDVGLVQTGNHNNIELHSEGSVTARVIQSGENGLITAVSRGSENEIYVHQYGIDGVVRLDALGHQNTLTIDQGGLDNSVDLQVTGQENDVWTQQSGAHNHIGLNASGSYSRFDVSQGGDNNQVSFSVSSSGKHWSVDQQGNNETITITD